MKKYRFKIEIPDVGSYSKVQEFPDDVSDRDFEKACDKFMNRFFDVEEVIEENS